LFNRKPENMSILEEFLSENFPNTDFKKVEERYIYLGKEEDVFNKLKNIKKY
jgi:hypothetical protein